MLNRQKTELIESSRGCFLICYKLLRPFQVHLRIFSKFKKCDSWRTLTRGSSNPPFFFDQSHYFQLILIGSTNREQNWKLIFRFVKPQAVYLSPLFLIFQIITGMMFFLLGLLIFLSLILNNIDKAIHSSAQKGYILNNGTLPNPMDMALVFLQNTFPLDYILYLGECQFGY